MTRRIYRKSQVTVSLFPFLAVLVCTMGALIVLLVLVVQQARVHATVVTEDGPTAEELAEAEALDDTRQEHLWRRDILEQQRLEVTKKQRDRRLQLSHLEDHIRRLEEKWKQLHAEADHLATSVDTDAQSRETASAELASLRQAIDQARQQLDQAKLAADQRPRSFAIIPYRGPNGTQRRPIFIECTAGGIVLQPEGLVITPADLEGPLGPGNPLDAALRATREYLVAHGLVGETGEPYPLLIVRPDGTEAYAAARNAMKTWDDEFGYELIEADAKLEYPAADPVLRDLIAKSLVDARQRQEILAAAMPSQYGGPGSGRGSGAGGGWGGGLVASPQHGGFIPAQQASAGSSRYASPARAQGGTGGRPGGTGQSGGSGQSGGTGTGAQSSNASSQADRVAQQGSSSQSAGNPGEQAGGEGNSLRPGSATSQAGQPAGRPSGSNSGGQAGPSSGGQAGSSRGGSATGSSMCASRGADWALPKASRNATGVTRPVRVACWPDRLLILPDQGDQRNPPTITIKNDLSDQIDEFVSEIWKHTDRWGLALAGGYWKPVVHVEVAPGGEAMFRELEQLMEGSGLEVKRKSW